MDVFHCVFFLVSCILPFIEFDDKHIQIHLDCKMINETEQEQGYVFFILVFLQLHDHILP